MTLGPIDLTAEMAIEFANKAGQTFDMQQAAQRCLEEFSELRELAWEALNDETDGTEKFYDVAFMEKFLKEVADSLYTYVFFIDGVEVFLHGIGEDEAKTKEAEATKAMALLHVLNNDADILMSFADLLDRTVGRKFVMEVIKKVHESNLTKIGPEGAVFNSEGKIMKPSFYIAPDLSGLANELVTAMKAQDSFNSVAA